MPKTFPFKSATFHYKPLRTKPNKFLKKFAKEKLGALKITLLLCITKRFYELQ